MKRNVLMWLHIFFAAVILSHSNCVNVPIKCPGPSPYHEDEICTAKIGKTDWDNKQRNFSWKDQNFTAGKVHVEFNVLDSFIYGLNVLVMDVSEEAECINKAFGDSYLSQNECKRTGFKYHSRRAVTITEENITNVEQCKEKMNIAFNLIYKGCYRLRIIIPTGEEEEYYDYNIDPDSNICSPPVFLNSTITKKIIFKTQEPRPHSAYDKKKKYMIHTISGLQKFHVSKINLAVRMCNNATNNTCKFCIGNTEEWKMTLNKAGSFTCRRGNESSNCFSLGGNEIQCITNTNGYKYQCLSVGINHHPCDGLGIWKNSSVHNNEGQCSWDSNLGEVSDLIEEPNLTERDDKLNIILISLIFCIILVKFCICVYFFRRKILSCFRRTPPDEPGRPIKNENLPEPVMLQKLLLLYSRDCEEFMILMEHFRNMLKEIGEYTVYDCFDEAIAEDIALLRQNWLNKLLSNDIKIIVVETKCAVLCQKAHNHAPENFYRKPLPMDNFFLHGLNKLTCKERSTPYKNIFVVGVEGFGNLKDKLDVPTNNAKYVLPQFMDELLRRLYSENKYSVHKETVKEHIKKLEEYVIKDPDYLCRLLRILEVNIQETKVDITQ